MHACIFPPPTPTHPLTAPDAAASVGAGGVPGTSAPPLSQAYPLYG